MRSLTRRSVLLVGGAATATGLIWTFGGGSLFYSALRPEFDGDTVSADRAYRLSQDGELTIVDIRRPDEWARTGTADGALRLDMRRADFADALLAAMTGFRDAPIALICARGVRSARMAQRLAENGFTHVSDIPEGMLGSDAGPGWLARDLPVSHD